MSWNYRVIYHPPKTKIVNGQEIEREEYYGIHEVYYDKNDKESLYSIDADVIGSSIEELKEGIEMMEKSLDRPVLDVSDFEEENENK